MSRRELTAREKASESVSKESHAAHSSEAYLSFTPISDVSPVFRNNYIVKSILLPGQVAILYGPSNVGKSFLCLYILACVATGKMCFGHRVRRSRIGYISLEPGQLHNRLQAIKLEHEVDENFLFSTDPINLWHSDDWTKTIIDKVRQNDIELIAIDPLGVAVAGANESDFKDASVYMRRLSTIARSTGAHVLAVAHPGKDEDAGIRGSYHHFATADAVIKIGINKQDKSLRSVTLTKSRDSAVGGQFNFTLETVTLGIDEDGDEVTTCLAREAQVDQSQSQWPRLNSSQRQRWELIRDLFADPNLTIMTVPAEGLGSEKCVRRTDVLHALEQKGLITRDSNGALPDKERRRFADILNMLKGKGLLRANLDWVWLLH